MTLKIETQNAMDPLGFNTCDKTKDMYRKAA